ncbi:molybdate ABC transporter substrate-binding protein [Algoriphagus sp.]|uniref:molybdate ABC transporter substrate-binding protein n=1 Tax=Algoriphagus sp. TaxID=1872435 RepID=UPI00391DF07A
MRIKVFILGLGLVLMAFSSPAQSSEKILIAAAADLKFALDSVIAVFNQTDKRLVQVTYGSSGKLFEQISNSAPFDLFFSADINYPNLLKERGFAASEVYPYGIGRIVLWSRKIDPTKDKMESLKSTLVRKIAIANPDHAPYGKRAVEAMKHYKVLDSVKGNLVFGENISQTAQFVTTGAADIGIIALSLALSPTMKRLGGVYYLIPDTSHQPLLQGAVITKRANQNHLAVDFLDFVKGSTATEILSYFGFTKP